MANPADTVDTRASIDVLRAIIESGRSDIEVVAINDLGPVETNAHLLRFDSVHGRFPGEVKVRPSRQAVVQVEERQPPREEMSARDDAEERLTRPRPTGVGKEVLGRPDQ